MAITEIDAVLVLTSIGAMVSQHIGRLHTTRLLVHIIFPAVRAIQCQLKLVELCIILLLHVISSRIKYL